MHQSRVQIAAQVGWYCGCDRNGTEYKRIKIAGVLPHCKKCVSTFVPQYPVPGGSMNETAEGEVPVLITQTRATPGRERSPSGHAGPVKPSAQLQLSTSINLHSLSGAASPPTSLSCPVLPVSCRVKLLCCQCQLEKRDHPVPGPSTLPMQPVATLVRYCVLRACALCVLSVCPV